MGTVKQRTIPFFNYPALFKRQKAEIMACLEDVLSRGAYILQKDLEAFEDTLKSYLGVKYAFGVADGTSALILSLRAEDIGPDEEVAFWKTKDPVSNFENFLLETQTIKADERDALQEKIGRRIADAFETANNCKYPTNRDLFDDVFSK